MASTGRDAAHEALPKLDPKLCSASAASANDSNPDVDSKTVSHPKLNTHEVGKPSVDPKLVGLP